MDELTKLQCAEAEIEALKAQVEQLQDKIFELQCFDVDVLRCLKTLAFEHNHADIKRYQPIAKKCMATISAGNKAEELKAQAFAESGSAQKAFWDGFERGAMSSNTNIRQHWNEYLELHY